MVVVKACSDDRNEDEDDDDDDDGESRTKTEDVIEYNVVEEEEAELGKNSNFHQALELIERDSHRTS